MGKIRDDNYDWTPYAVAASNKIMKCVSNIVIELKNDGLTYEEIEVLFNKGIRCVILQDILKERKNKRLV